MTKIAKAKQFVSDNRTYLAFMAGGFVSSATTYYALGGNVTLLKLTKSHAELLKQGGTVVYELKDQTVNLINIPAAIEAAESAL